MRLFFKSPMTYATIASSLLATLILVACGGGGGGTGSTVASTGLHANTTTLTGTAVDAPIASATITITAGAPLNDPGATPVGSAVTASSVGAFTINVTLPTGSVPIFANALDPNNPMVVLSSYLGQSDVLTTAGTLSSASLPDLDITPVTTASLAVYAQLNASSYAALTPTTYAATVQGYSSDILAISAAIKAVGDNLCTPTTAPTSTTNLAAQIASAANLSSGNSTTLSTVATILGGNCGSVLATLPQLISSDPQFGPQLHLGDVVETAASAQATLPAATYVLQGVIAESGKVSANVSASVVAPTVFKDVAVTVSAAGVITSTDAKVSGTVIGNMMSLTIINGASTYALRAKVGLISAALVTGGSAYAVMGGGTNSSSVLTQFQAVLAPSGVSPVWNGAPATTTTTTQNRVTCPAASFPMRLDAFGTDVGGSSIGECITPSATGWTMVAGTVTTSSVANYDFEHLTTSSTLLTAPVFIAPTWTEIPGSPFILMASNASYTSASYTNASSVTSTSTTTYYVMGTPNIIFATATANNQLNIEGGGGNSGVTSNSDSNPLIQLTQGSGNHSEH